MVTPARAMSPDEARRVLGVDRDASETALRAAFRRLVMSHHPDVAGAGGSEPTASIIAAYRVLRQAHAPVGRGRDGRATSTTPRTAEETTVPSAARPTARPAGPLVWAEGDRVWLALPPEDAWAVLLRVADGLGEVAYVDARAGLLETIVTFEDHPVCSVVISLSTRPDNTTEAWCTAEALTGDPPPPSQAVARLIAARARSEGRRGGGRAT
jgi:DnaJ domain